MRKRHIDTPPAAPPPAPANDQAAGAVFTVAELAARWRVCRQSITAYIRAGQLQAFRLGGRAYRIRADEVARFEQSSQR